MRKTEGTYMGMKRVVSSLLLLMVTAVAMGQTDHGYNLYGQLFGPSTGIGIGFDTRFRTGGVLGYSAGLAFTNISWSDDDGLDGWGSSHEVDSRGLAIPLEVNAIMGSRTSKFEIGLGLTAYLVRREETHYGMEFIPADEVWHSYPTSDYRRVFRPNIIGTLNIGYRLQRRSGFFMKLGLTLLVGDLHCSPIDGVAALPNVCLGYTIPHF